MVVDDATGTIAWIGGDEAAAVHVDAVDEVVELDGALVTPAFVDAHAHTSQTGAGLRGVDLGATQSVVQALSRIEDAARKGQGRPVYAPNWDQGGWAERRPHTGAELDRATYGGVVYSPRVDGHSAVISSALAAASGARDLPGWEGDGLVTKDAHHAAREAFNGAVTPAQRQADIDLALQAAAAAGIGLVQENGGRTLSGTDDFAEVLAAGERGDGPADDRLLGPARGRRGRGPRRRHRARGAGAGGRPQHRRLDRVAHGPPARRLHRRRRSHRQCLPHGRAGPRPRGRLFAGRSPGRVPRHRRRRGGHRDRRVRSSRRPGRGPRA